jgi:ligand-binding sensor domain-containing protein
MLLLEYLVLEFDSMKRTWLLLHVFGIIFFASAAMYAQPAVQKHQEKPFQQYFIRTWQSEQGLPHNAGRALIQTFDGYIWIGSQDGLVRYNGKEFYVFTKYNTPAFKHHDVTTLLQTADSNLWIGTFNGLIQYKQGVFLHHSLGSDRERQVVRALAADRAGNLWIGTMNAGLLKYKNGKMESFTTAQGLCSNSISAVAEDFYGNIWVSTLLGINVYRGGEWSFYNYPRHVLNNDGQDILIARDSSVWIGTSSGLLRWNKNSFSTYTKADGLSDEVIRSLYQDRSGALWIGTERGGICRFVGGGFSSFRAADGLASDFIDAILEDREGNYWIGNYTEGVNQLQKSKFFNYSVREGLPKSTIRTILQAHDGVIWIGTEGSGVIRFDGKKFLPLSTRDGMPNDFIRSLFEDTHGFMWIGTRDGLVRYHQGKIQIYKERDGLAHTFIRAIVEDHEGTIWVGTVNGGIHRFVHGKFINYRALGIPMDAVRSVLVDHNNNLWISGNETVMLWNNGKMTALTSKDGLPAEPIYTMYEDSAHTMWFGTNGGGLIRFKGGLITRYTYTEGLGDDVVYSILEDNIHNFWMSCNGGIFKVSKQMLEDYADGKISRIRSTFYDAADGMISNEVSGNSQPAGWKSSDGRLWFPALRGVVVVDPVHINENSLPPPVIIERAVFDTVEVHMPQNGFIVRPGFGRVEFHFAALTYISQDRVQFRYMLEGFDKNWSTSNERNQATYTNLPPGNYTFRVTASNSDGVWNEAGTSLTIEMEPYYYQTKWFYGLIILSVIGVGIGINRWRVWDLIKKEKELKKRVDDALAQIKVLGGLIPICASCKKIRDDRGFWNQLETYIRDHSEASFTHGLCPECAEKLFEGIRPKE